MQVLSDVQPGQVDTTRTGLVHRAVMDDFPDLRKCDVYVCGSPELVRAARTDLRRSMPPAVVDEDDAMQSGEHFNLVETMSMNHTVA